MTALEKTLLKALKDLLAVHDDATGKIKLTAKERGDIEDWYNRVERQARAAIAKATGAA